MVVEACDGCAKVGLPLEEIGFLGHRYCVECSNTAQLYQALVREIRGRLAKAFETELFEARAGYAEMLKRLPDQP